MDSDGDGVIDAEDNAPNNRLIHRTNFNKYMSVPLTSGLRITNPEWHVKGNVRSHTPLSSDPI